MEEYVKKYKIKEEDIKSLMTSLEISRDEAIEVWLTDHDIIKNEEQDILSKKAKDNGTNLRVRAAKPSTEKKKRTRKKDMAKIEIVDILTGALNDTVENLIVVNNEKIIEFDYKADHYKLDLMKQRIKKS